MVPLDNRPSGDKWKAAAVLRLRSLLVLTAIVVAATSCVPEGLAFVKDDRVEIVAPEGHTKVSLPVTIEWEVKDFEITGEAAEASDTAGYFGVFVDTVPVPPRRKLDWIAREDRVCLNTNGCPDDTYFADRGVYETEDTSLTLKRLPDLDAYQGHETHEVTVILLDGTGRRISENAWHVTFFYDREV